MLQIPTSLKSAPEALNSPPAIKAYDDFAAAAARDSFWTYRKHMPAWDWFPRRLAREARSSMRVSGNSRRNWHVVQDSSANLPDKPASFFGSCPRLSFNDLATKCGRPAHDHWTISALRTVYKLVSACNDCTFSKCAAQIFWGATPIGVVL